MRFRLLFAVIVAYSAFLSFYNLGGNSLHNDDEAHYATLSKEMLVGHHWLTPLENEAPYLRKPPARFWLGALSFAAFGTSDWAGRLWSALAMIGTVVFTILLGWELFGPTTGLLAGCSLSTTMQLIYEHGARTGETDTLLIFWLTAGLYFLIRSEKKPPYLVLSFALMGMASLTKNFTGMIPFAITLIYWSVNRKWKTLDRPYLLIALMVFLALSFGWLIAMLAVYRWQFVQVFLVQQVLNRAVSDQFRVGINSARSFTGGLHFAAATLARGSFPWSLLMVPALFFSAFHIKQWTGTPRTLPLIWLAFYTVVLLLIKSKCYWYVFPLYPAQALIIAWFLSETITKTGFSWEKTATAGLLIAGLLLFVLSPTYDPSSQDVMKSAVQTVILKPGPSSFFLIPVIFSLWLLLQAGRPRMATAFLALILATGVIVYSAGPLIYSSGHADIQEMAAEIADHAGDSENALYLWRIQYIPGERRVTDWYMKTIPRTRILSLSRNTEPLKQLLSEGGDKLFLIPKPDYQEIRSIPHRTLLVSIVSHKTYVLIAPVEQSPRPVLQRSQQNSDNPNSKSPSHRHWKQASEIKDWVLAMV